MVERVRSNQTGLQNRTFRPEQVKEALLDPQTWCHCGIAICTTLPTSGLGGFANIISTFFPNILCAPSSNSISVNSFGFTVLQTQLLAMVLGALIIAVLLSSTWLVKKYNQTCLTMAVYCIP
jgi:hypothetical protein